MTVPYYLSCFETISYAIASTCRKYPHENDDINANEGLLALNLCHIVHRALYVAAYNILSSPRVITAVAIIPTSLSTPVIIIVTIIAIDKLLHPIVGEIFIRIDPLIRDRDATYNNTTMHIVDLAVLCFSFCDLYRAPGILYAFTCYNNVVTSSTVGCIKKLIL